MTPVQIAGVKDTTEGDMDMLDGYEDLPNDLQEKVKQAFEDGHVADDDWKGASLPRRMMSQSLTHALPGSRAESSGDERIPLSGNKKGHETSRK